jgi:hypothetical protein
MAESYRRFLANEEETLVGWDGVGLRPDRMGVAVEGQTSPIGGEPMRQVPVTDGD